MTQDPDLGLNNEKRRRDHRDYGWLRRVFENVGLGGGSCFV